MLEGAALKTKTRVVQLITKPSIQEVKTEICVVGAGIAGVSAAIEAARLGRQVTLVDGLPSLGGQAVHSIIGTFCGLFTKGKKRKQLTHGIADDILLDLGKIGAVHFMEESELNTVLYDEVALSRWIEKTVQEAGIQVITGSILRKVNKDERRITSIELASKYGDIRIFAQGFVDATGDAALTWLSGLKCRVPENGPVYGSLMTVLEGIHETYYPSRKEISDRLKEKAGEYGLQRKDGFAFLFPKKGTALVNMNHIETPLDPFLLVKEEISGKKEAEKTLEFLKTEFPLAFGDARIRSYGFAGIRQTRWIVGKKQLTVEEVRAGVRFPDAIARTIWPIELHSHKEGYIWEEFPEDHIHYVPFGSLVPPDADNLVAAGRCIDGDVAALSSVRVMGPCIAMGAAAAHALDLSMGQSVHEIDINILQERLSDNIWK